jgi:hypothetical protein
MHDDKSMAKSRRIWSCHVFSSLSYIHILDQPFLPITIEAKKTAKKFHHEIKQVHSQENKGMSIGTCPQFG